MIRARIIAKYISLHVFVLKAEIIDNIYIYYYKKKEKKIVVEKESRIHLPRNSMSLPPRVLMTWEGPANSACPQHVFTKERKMKKRKEEESVHGLL